MRNVFLSLTLALSTAVHGIAAAGPEVPAGDAGAVQVAPLNSDFEKFMKNPVIQGIAPGGVSLGYIPPPMDMSHLTGLVPPGIAAVYPAAYDLRTTGKLPTIRDQGPCGSCWSFAAMASLESGLMPGETRDFSENNLKNTAGFDRGPCDGGNDQMAMAYLMRWSGPVDETDDPYQPNEDPSPPGLVVKKHAQNLTILPPRASGPSNNTIKAAVMSHGAVSTSMMWDDAYYNETNRAYYYSGSSSSNHAVAIVGWDDRFPASSFNILPPGNGAFLIRNSWGPIFGESGYFYISYYDGRVGKDLVVYTPPEGTTNFSRIYSYDPLGAIGGLGYIGVRTIWFANVFTSSATESISAAGFFNADMNSSYELYVYTNLTNPSDPRSGTLAAMKTGTLENAGYETIRLDSPAAVSSGQKFSVVVKLTTPNYDYPAPLELAITGYSSDASALPGQSFYSSAGTTWYDLNGFDHTANFSVKAYAGTSTHDMEDHIGVYRGGGWYLDKNGNGTWDSGIDTTASFGITGDIPVSGNWTGTGNSKIGVFRNGAWYLDMNGNGAWDTGTDAAYNFGIPTDIPITGKWSGDSITKIGVFRAGAWYLDTNGNGAWDGGDTSFAFGIPGDKPVTGDWTGSGTTKIGVVRGNSWFLDMNGNGSWDSGIDSIYSFGIPSDAPITGDWTGTGITRIGVVRDGSSWFLDINGNGAWDDVIDATIRGFGIAGDLPVTGSW